MIKTVELQNWKTHLNSKLEFSKGTNVLVGAMGSGKSLPYNELVLVKEADNWKKDPIGNVVEKSLNASEKVEKLGNGTAFTKGNPFDIRVQTVNPKTLKMEEQKISQFIKHEAPKEVIKIKTKQGKEITVTSDHSLLVFENGALKPIKGCDIKEGDFIPCPKKMMLKCSPGYLDVSAELPEFRETNRILDGLELIKKGTPIPKAAKQVSVTKFTLANWRNRKRTHSRNLVIAKHLALAIPAKIKLSNEFARICGAYVAEGSNDYSPKKSRYKLQLTNNDEKFLETVEKDWKCVFSRVPIKRINNNSQANSKVVSALFSKLFGSTAGEKKLPNFIFWFNDEFLSNFLKMYFEGDGYISEKRAELTCSSKSMELIDGIQTILCRWGIITRIRTVKRKQGQYYELLVLPKHIPLFAKHVAFLSERKQRALLKWVKILENRKRWDGVDIIPNMENLLKKLTYEYALGKRKNKKMRNIAHQLLTYRTKENIGREKLARTLEQIFENYKFKTPAFEKLEKILNSDIFFDKIIGIEKMPCPSKHVYDFAVEGTENFVAGLGNILTHNTSVMDAICFALFGTFPALQQRRIALQEIIMARPNQMEQCSVRIVFLYNGKNFEVERKIKTKGSSEAKLYVDGIFAAGPKPQDVNAAIERNIEISYNLFSRAVYSEQNQIDYFLRLPPGQRKEKFDELLELDKYEMVRSNAVTALNRLKALAVDKKKWLQEQEKEIGKEELSELEKKLGEKQKRLEELKSEGEKKGKELSRLKEEVEQFEEKEKLFAELSEAISKKLVLAEKLEDEIKEGEKRLKGLSVEAIEKSAEEKNDKANGIEKEIKGLEKREKELIEKSSAVQQEIKGNNAKAGEIGELTEQVEKAGAKCPVCKTPLDEKKKKDIGEEHRESIEVLAEKNNALKKKIAEFEGNEKKAREGIEKKEQEREKIGEELAELGRLLELSKKAEEKKSQMEKLMKEVTAEKKKIEGLGFDEAKARHARDALIRGGAELNANKKEQLAAQELLDGIKREMERAEKRREQVEELKKLVKAMEENSEKLQLFTNSLRETQAQLRESLIETINEAMDSIWQKIYPYGDYSSAKMGLEKGNYELMAKDSGGNWVRVDGILSGGERSAAAICIRIAFSLVLTRNLSWIILDEPTHNLDTTAVNYLSRMMRESLPELIEQVFVITHDKEMEKAASGKLYMLKRNKGIDEPTRLEEIALEG